MDADGTRRYLKLELQGTLNLGSIKLSKSGLEVGCQF